MSTRTLVLIFLIIFAPVALTACSSTSPIPDWAGAPWGPFNLVDPEQITNPVLTAADITDRNAGFLADPFLFHDENNWFLFFEMYNNDTLQGDIGMATSQDGLHWKYDSIVLDEEFHLSYPDVFKYKGDYYMLPETHQLREVRLYKAVNFPREWKYLATPIAGKDFVDPSIFFYNGRWWLFVGDKDNSTLYLYSSKSLLRNWVEHPLSPIVKGDAGTARPGGRSFVYNVDKIIRIAQDNQAIQKVKAFQVDALDTSQYKEHQIPESPLLQPGDNPPSWYAGGMHQFDPWWVGDHWLAAFDGKDDQGIYSIGIKLALQPSP